MSGQRKIVEETRAILVATFPLAFFPKGQPKRPLKIGIRDDLAAALPGTPSTKINTAVHDYCSGQSYLDALIAGRGRVDLAGAAVGIVTDAEAQHAARRVLGLRSLTKLERDYKALEKAAGKIVETFAATPDGIISASLGADVLAAIQATRDAHARAVAP